jgi:uncharacterized repeat protein (TIGR01451 family)
MLLQVSIHRLFRRDTFSMRNTAGFLWFCIVLAFSSLNAQAQTCAAPGKDGPATISGSNVNINTYFQGNGNLGSGATSLVLGAQTGTANVSVGDKLLLVQMQGAEINTSNNNCYGDGRGPCTDTDTRAIGSDKAQGFLENANYTAGRYEYVRVTAVTGAGGAGSSVNFFPALSFSYTQASPDLTIGQRRYQVIRVPQYSTLSISGSISPIRWDGLVGGIVALDVAGAVSFSGAGPHVNASGTGFRTSYAERGAISNGDRDFVLPAVAFGGARDTPKAEGIAGTPRFMWIPNDPLSPTSVGAFFTNPDLNANAQGYPGGDYGRGAPGNAGGSGISHNSAGGGGGNGGRGGAGGATWSGDASRDVGGYGGGKVPQSGAVDANRIVMGGGGAAGDVNGGGTEPANPYEGPGGQGGGLIFFNAGAPGSGGWLQTNGTEGPVSFFDAAGGGGAGGSIRLIAGSNTSLVRMQADGGQGGVHDATGGATHCSGSGGGGAGGVLVANGAFSGSNSVNGGLQGANPPNNPINCQGDAGEVGATLNFSPSTQVGVQPGYQCLPQLVVSKLTLTPTRTAPPNTTAQYQIVIRNTGGGAAYGVSAQDTLPVPFGLAAVGSTASVALSTSTGPSPVASSSGNTPTVIFGTAGGSTLTSYVLSSGGAVTLTFPVNLNTTTTGIYQNSANVRYTDPVRSTGGAADAGGNPSVTPGGTYANGNPVPGSNYAASSSTQEDVSITGTTPTVADIQAAKSGTSFAYVGDPVSYILTVSNNGPANAGTVTVADIVPANIGTVTWVCVVIGGTGDCDGPASGTGASGSGNNINLPQVVLNSGAAIQITVAGTAITSGTVTNFVTATLATPGLTDSNPSNNSATATTRIDPRTADLLVIKSNGVSTLTTGAVTVYTINVGNNGPAPVSNAVLIDPTSAGLTALSVSCTAFGGAVCPAGLTTATLAAGIAIPSLPVGSTVSILLSAQVTATAGSRVTNTATISAPAGTVDPVSSNNSSADSDPIIAAVVSVISAANICPVNTTEQLTNLLTNGNLANVLASVGGNIPQFPADVYPGDTSESIQQGAKNYLAGVVIQNPFIGDIARSVAGTNNWLYSNGNNLAGTPNYRIYSQQITTLVPGRQYVFMYYGSNALAGGATAADLPNISMRVNTGTTTLMLATHSYANEPAGTDTWTLRQAAFTATTATMSMELWDAAAGVNGDDFASTQFILRECRPQADPRVTKTDGVSAVTALNQTTYSVVVSNPGPGDAGGVLVSDPAALGLQKDSISCSASAGAQCPLVTTISGIEGAGLVLPQLSANSTVTFIVVATVQALNGTVTNSVSLSLPPDVIDSNPGNNSATDVNTVQAIANVAIAKTNNTNTLVAGSTTSYTITVSHFGPSPADNAVLRDTPSAGLSCAATAACTSNNGNLAVCPGGTVGSPNTAIPLATLISGATLPRFRQGGVLNIVLTCGVSATGL